VFVTTESKRAVFIDTNMSVDMLFKDTRRRFVNSFSFFQAGHTWNDISLHQLCFWYLSTSRSECSFKKKKQAWNYSVQVPIEVLFMLNFELFMILLKFFRQVDFTYT